MERQILWTNWSGTTMEHVQIAREGRSIAADGIVTGIRDGVPFRSHYAITCDDKWRTRQISVEVPGKPPLRLLSDGAGTWENALRAPMPDYDGVIDVALIGSPLTFVLPYQRFRPELGSRYEVPTVRIDLFALTVMPADVRVGRALPAWNQRDSSHASEAKMQEPRRMGLISSASHGHVLLRHEDRNTNVSVTIQLDEDGLPEDIPGQYRRLYPSERFPAAGEHRSRVISAIDDYESPMEEVEEIAPVLPVAGAHRNAPDPSRRGRWFSGWRR